MRPDQVKRFERLLRRAYQGDVEHRGRPELQLVSYPLTAPVAVAGEVPVATQPALLERVISVTPSPHWLPAYPEAKDAYRHLMALPLSAFASVFIPWCLQRPLEEDLSHAAQILEATLDGSVLPNRVRDNLLVVVFGLFQFTQFGADMVVPTPAPLDIPTILPPWGSSSARQTAAPGRPWTSCWSTWRRWRSWDAYSAGSTTA